VLSDLVNLVETAWHKGITDSIKSRIRRPVELIAKNISQAGSCEFVSEVTGLSADEVKFL
jgi:hypothetical protein